MCLRKEDTSCKTCQTVKKQEVFTISKIVEKGTEAFEALSLERCRKSPAGELSWWSVFAVRQVVVSISGQVAENLHK